MGEKDELAAAEKSRVRGSYFSPRLAAASSLGRLKKEEKKAVEKRVKRESASEGNCVNMLRRVNFCMAQHEWRGATLQSNRVSKQHAHIYDCLHWILCV